MASSRTMLRWWASTALLLPNNPLAHPSPHKFAGPPWLNRCHIRAQIFGGAIFVERQRGERVPPSVTIRTSRLQQNVAGRVRLGCHSATPLSCACAVQLLHHARHSPACPSAAELCPACGVHRLAVLSRSRAAGYYCRPPCSRITSPPSVPTYISPPSPPPATFCLPCLATGCLRTSARSGVKHWLRRSAR